MPGGVIPGTGNAPRERLVTHSECFSIGYAVLAVPREREHHEVCPRFHAGDLHRRTYGGHAKVAQFIAIGFGEEAQGPGRRWRAFGPWVARCRPSELVPAPLRGHFSVVGIAAGIIPGACPLTGTMHKPGTIVHFAAIAVFILTGCAESEPWEPVEIVRAGSHRMEILTPGGILGRGANRVAVQVTNDGQPVEIEAASLAFHMPAMGAMQRMDTHADLSPRNGRAEGALTFEMAGGWYGEVEVTTAAGPVAGTFDVQVR